MWEFSIVLDASHNKVAEFLYRNIKSKVVEVDGIITSYEEFNKISIVLACNEEDKARLFYYVGAYITEAICTYFKKEFLNRNLKINLKDKISIIAFEKALLCFDKETDRYLINKYLSLDKNIFLESFFEFKLKVLKNKWLELAKIANENSGYLLADGTFIELLKFLIDNLEINYDVVNIISNNEKYHILDENFTELESDKGGDAGWLIGNIISLSPRKINIYSDDNVEDLSLMLGVFEDRINILPKESVKIVDKNM